MAGQELELRPEDGLRWYYPSRRHGWVSAGVGGFFAYFLAQSTDRADDSEQLYIALAFLLIVAPLLFVAWRHLLRKRPTLIATTFGLVTDPIGHPHRLIWWHEISHFSYRGGKLPFLLIWLEPWATESVTARLHGDRTAGWIGALRNWTGRDEAPEMTGILASQLDATLDELVHELSALRAANLGTAARVYEAGER